MTEKIAAFVLHLLVATVGCLVITAMLGFSFYLAYPKSQWLDWLFGPPACPVLLMFAASAGAFMSQKVDYKAAQWIWVVPALPLIGLTYITGSWPWSKSFWHNDSLGAGWNMLPFFSSVTYALTSAISSRLRMHSMITNASAGVRP
jgi:hypothetical protein